MMTLVQNDFRRWLPELAESPLHYWTSLSPFAPVLGVRWRFADDLSSGLAQVAELAAVAATLSEPVLDEIIEPVAVAAQALVADAADGSADMADDAAEPTVEAAAATASDDLSLIKGIGPKMVARLAACGVTRFTEIAVWDAAGVAHFDQVLGGIPGRIERDDWVGQARALA